MRTIRGSINSYARRQVRKEINKYVRSRGNVPVRKVEDTFTSKTLWDFIKWVCEPEKL
jgi:hypothetical protein